MAGPLARVPVGDRFEDFVPCPKCKDIPIPKRTCPLCDGKGLVPKPPVDHAQGGGYTGGE